MQREVLHIRLDPQDVAELSDLLNGSPILLVLAIEHMNRSQTSLGQYIRLLISYRQRSQGPTDEYRSLDSRRSLNSIGDVVIRGSVNNRKSATDSRPNAIQQYSDSGYGTGEHKSSDVVTFGQLSSVGERVAANESKETDEADDCSTLYSDASSAPTQARNDYISDLAELLFSNLAVPSNLSNVLDRMPLLISNLPDLLKEFALKLGQGPAITPNHLDVMRFVHKYRG